MVLYYLFDKSYFEVWLSLVVHLGHRVYSIKFNNYPFINQNEWYYRELAQFGSTPWTQSILIIFLSLQKNSPFFDLSFKIGVVIKMPCRIWPTTIYILKIE